MTPAFWWCPKCAYETADGRLALAHEASGGIDHRCQRWTPLDNLDPVALRALVA